MSDPSLKPKTAPRTLPAGWWEGVPEFIRSGYYRKVLRQGYILNADQAVFGRNFFRNVHRGIIKDGGGEFTCLFQHAPKQSKSDHRINAKCSCMTKVGAEACHHLAALLFNVYSGPGATPFSDSYGNSIWALLALNLCRGHAQTKVSHTEAGVHRALVLNEQGQAILELGMSEENPGAWYSENLFPSQWELLGKGQSPRRDEFVEWASQEILLSEKAHLKTMGHTPSLRSEFGPIGDLCRQGFLVNKRLQAVLNWLELENAFRFDFEDSETGLKGFARLDIEQAYSLHKKFSWIQLGQGFDEGIEIGEVLVFEEWQKGLEIRVAADSRLQIRPFATYGDLRFFPQAEGQEIRFGDRILIGKHGFRKVVSGEFSLLKKYLGWKTYFVEAADVPGFIQKFGPDFMKHPTFDIDPLMMGKHQAVEMEEISIAMNKKAGPHYQVGIEFHTGKGKGASVLDLNWLKSKWDAKQLTHLTPEGWVDLTDFEWSWLKQIKPENWTLENGQSLLNLDLPQLFRLCALHQPKAIRLKQPDTNSVSLPYQELEYLKALGKEKVAHPLHASAIPSEGLRPYQQEGLQWLANLVSYGLSGLLADDMGLGKTHQVMSLVAWNFARSGKSNKTLVVCPTSVLYHWKTKFGKFHPDIKSSVYHGGDRNKSDLTQPVCITSYGIVRNDLEFFKQAGFDLLILDEIQFLKNRDSETHKALREFPTRSIIGLTGTPLENSPMDVKNLFDLLLPGYFPGEGEFRRTIIEPLESSSTAEKARNHFLGLCRPFILRRTKAEVLTDLPEKVEETSFCDMAENQSALYQECLLKRGGPLLSELQGNSTSSLLHVFQLLNHLKQICNHPLTLPDINESEMDYQSGKWDLFIYLLESALEAGHKVVVFSQYLAMLSRIDGHLKKCGIGYVTLTGSTRDRETVLKKFASDPACRVFCCSLKAGGVGIDLTSASTVIHYDRWWNAAKENQATDRVHRIGQNRNVQVYKLVTRNTIEEKIDAIIRKKAAWMDSLLPNDAEGGLKLFTREELLELLSPMGNGKSNS